MKLEKLKKPVVRPTFLVNFWCVNSMFKFVLEKVFEFNFDSIMCPFFLLIQKEGCSTREQFFEEAVA